MSSRSGLRIRRFVTPSVHESTPQASVRAENTAVSAWKIPFHASDLATAGGIEQDRRLWHKVPPRAVAAVSIVPSTRSRGRLPVGPLRLQVVEFLGERLVLGEHHTDLLLDAGDLVVVPGPYRALQLRTKLGGALGGL